MSIVTRFPAPFSIRPTFFHVLFLLLLVGLWKPFLLPFMSLTRFDFRWALVFLILSLCTQTVSIYFSWMT